jgi:hypothetical protein
VHCFRAAGGVELMARSGEAIGDLGYEGAPEVITPIKKRAGSDLADAERQFNTRLAQMRVAVEWEWRT